MFRYVNFQVLPVNSDGEIGAAGYSKIMLGLKGRKDVIFRERRLQEVAAVLRNDMFFYAYSIHEESGYFYGQFLKYDLAEQVENIYTGEVEFNGGNGSSTHRFYFDYVFDCERHVFAIEEAGGRLPSAKELEKAIVHVFSPVVNELFPECVVEAVVLSEAGKLRDVFEKADGFYSAEVNVTYSNNRFALKKIKKSESKA
ncbi:DUF4747 family protein [Chromobacterium haemolyticum]|uniref:DUF4747 family protein n=1 Tax=Chromobacterium haemolyticum TaxID=394935 RepID=UPI0013B3A56B|nr:DUF4747 family protein [Chromobacterium haemolyticum]